ncbi:MAG: hypothetical protein OIF48_06830 [Silicimonas sp.]|nr:hypothetical protein [Silicimonas sp.]
MKFIADPLVLGAFGVAAGLLSTFAYLPYIRDTLSGNAQPQRASWLIWSVLGSIAFFSQLYEGAGASLWFAAVQVSGTLLVLLLSVWKGQGAYLRPVDYTVLTCAAVGLFLWYQTETAAWALSITIGVSLLGGFLTVAKSYHMPQTETLTTWPCR